jgi:hypothetical protein
MVAAIKVIARVVFQDWFSTNFKIKVKNPTRVSVYPILAKSRAKAKKEIR